VSEEPASGGIRYPFPDPPEEGAAVEVAPGILWLRMPLPMKLDHVNVYALDDGDGWTIVDTGFDTRRTRTIWEAVLAGPLGGRPVQRLIVTHHHPDHVGLAGWFQARGAELWMPRTGWLMARMLTLDVQESYPAETLEFYLRAGMDPVVFAARKGERPFNFADVVAPMPLGYRRIVEGEVRVLFVGAAPMEIVHKRPRSGGLSATLKAGAEYTRHPPDAPEFARLMSAFVKRDLPSLLPVLGLEAHPLPLLWTADFILGGPRPPWVDGEDYYFIGELNCACVGMTTQLHLAPLVAREAVRVCERKRAQKRTLWTQMAPTPTMFW